jgi:hypothetical protein
MSELTFFDYNIIFKQHKTMYENNIFSMVSNKILSKIIYKQLKENGENAFAHHFLHYQENDEGTNLVVSFVDVDTNLINKLVSMAKGIESELENDEVLKDYLTIKEIKFTKYVVPADFVSARCDNPSQRYCLVKDSSGVFYFFVNDKMKAIGDYAIKMAYGIYKREHICPQKYLFEGNIENLTKDNHDLKLSDLTKKLV